MALKDWKKVGSSKYSWVRKDDKWAVISFTKNYKDAVTLYYYDIKEDKEHERIFKTKSQALKFAKSYMRTH